MTRQGLFKNGGGLARLLMIALLIVTAGASVVLAAPETGAAESTTTADGAGVMVWIWWLLAFGAAIFALFNARKYFGEVMAADEGEPRMQEIATYVREGAMAYLKQQYRVV
ncbi:MAG: sodium/proton-translocating pyrophosphatase, partial [Phycisphaerales bacterium]|nr:sodium/proton-translocating pyrophosphatase [Phycisphaerales bacterium]